MPSALGTPNLKERLHALDRSIWRTDAAAQPAWRARLLTALRVAIVLGRDLGSGQLTMRAMSLVYTTLLSIVPLLALSFSVLKGFGVHNQIEPALLNLLDPLGEQGTEVTARIITFIENMHVGVLGSVGLALLLYTAVSLMQKVEESFNFIWRVGQLRSLSERFSRYVSALLIGPVLVFAALGVTASVMNTALVQALLELQPLGRIVYAISKLVPYLLVISAFTFLYVFIPNTKVQIRAALVAGLVGGLLWQSAGWAFATFVASSTQYAAIYSGFAILVLFMIWVYVSWLVLLIGSSVGFYVQHPEYLVTAGGEPSLSNRMRERLALAVMALVATRFRRGEPALTREQLARELVTPDRVLDPVLASLQGARLIVPTSGPGPAYVPARDMDSILIVDVVQSVRSAGEDRYFNPLRVPVGPQVNTILDRTERAINEALHGTTVASLVQESDAPATVPRPDRKAVAK
jgi:membrane protein